MAEWWEWTGEPGPWESNAAPDMYAGGSPTFTEGGGSTLPTTWEEYQRGGYAQLVPEALASRPDLYGPNAAADYLAQGGGYPTGGGDPGGSFWGSLGNLLRGAGGTAAGALGGGGGGGILGPLLSSLGSLGGGAIGSNAANEAARLQSQALNRGIDLQTAQWLQQQQNLAPYLQAGQGGLAQLQQLAGREQPGLPGAMASIDPRAYGMPNATPQWPHKAIRGQATSTRRTTAGTRSKDHRPPTFATRQAKPRMRQRMPQAPRNCTRGLCPARRSPRSVGKSCWRKTPARLSDRAKPAKRWNRRRQPEVGS